MCRQQTHVVPLLVILAAAGCSQRRLDEAWPERRPLARSFDSPHPPRDPSPATQPAAAVEEPTGTITLRQVLAAALTGNPDLAAAGWEVRAAEARTLQAGLSPNPELEFGMEEFAGTGELSGTGSAEVVVALSQTIETAGKRAKRERAAALEGKLAGWDREAMRLDVVTEATQAFVALLAAQQRLALTEELLKLAQAVHRTAEERVRSGKVPPLEASKAKVELATSRIERDQAAGDLTVARRLLAATWGGSRPRFDRAHGPLPPVRSVPAEQQLLPLLEQNPGLARWTAELQQRRAALDLEQANGVPDLTVAWGVQHLGEVGETGMVAGLAVPLPLVDRNQGGILEARYRLVQAEHQRRAARTRLRASLAEAYQSLVTALAQATTLRDDVLPTARQAFAAAREGYRRGKFSYLDVLGAQRTFFDVRSRHIAVLADYHKARADVERLIGEPLDSVEGSSRPEKQETGGE